MNDNVVECSDLFFFAILIHSPPLPSPSKFFFFFLKKNDVIFDVVNLVRNFVCS